MPLTCPRIEQIPLPIMEKYRNIILCVDIMYVNGTAFLMSISREIQFITSEHITSPKPTATQIANCLKNINRVYRQRGFKIEFLIGDGEFEKVRGGAADMHIEVNITGEDEHVPEIERCIRTVKERTRCIWSVLRMALQTQKMEEIWFPTRLIIEFVKTAVFWRNAFPVQHGVSDRLSPTTIVTGRMIDFQVHC